MAVFGGLFFTESLNCSAHTHLAASLPCSVKGVNEMYANSVSFVFLLFVPVNEVKKSV